MAIPRVSAGRKAGVSPQNKTDARRQQEQKYRLPDSAHPRPHNALRPFCDDSGTAFARIIVRFLILQPEVAMAQQKHDAAGANITRERLIELLNEDLAREYQAIIAYVVYSQVLKGPEY